MMGDPGVNSVRVPLEICSPTNADFDGHEMWMLALMTLVAMREAWERVWIRSSVSTVFEAADRIAIENELDSAILTTMTFEQMATHKGGDMYTFMMLKPKLWGRS